MSTCHDCKTCAVGPPCSAGCSQENLIKSNFYALLYAGNFCLGLQHSALADILFLVDYGFAQAAPGPASKMEDNFVGTPDFASISCMRHKRCGPKDDLESLCYVLLSLWLGSEWQIL